MIFKTLEQDYDNDGNEIFTKEQSYEGFTPAILPLILTNPLKDQLRLAMVFFNGTYDSWYLEKVKENKNNDLPLDELKRYYRASYGNSALVYIQVWNNNEDVIDIDI